MTRQPDFKVKYARWAPGRGPASDLLRVLGYAEDGLMSVSVVEGNWRGVLSNVPRDWIVITSDRPQNPW